MPIPRRIPSLGPARRWLGAGTGALLSALLVLGCGSAGGGGGGGGDARLVGLTAAPEQPGASAGLEVESWVLREDATDLAGVLRGYADEPIPGDPGVVALWAGEGLRLVSVPTPDVDGLRRSLVHAGPVTRRWLGQFPRWSELVRGGSPPAGAVVLGRWSDADRHRLLCRSWVAPGADGSAVVRVDLTPQVLARSSDAWRRGVPAARAIEDEGAVLGELALELELRPGRSLVLVPASPGAWAEGLRGPEPSGAASGSGVAPGPEFPSAITLGESLLGWGGGGAGVVGVGDGVGGVGGDGGRGSGARVVLVLTARAPGRFGLLP